MRNEFIWNCLLNFESSPQTDSWFYHHLISFLKSTPIFRNKIDSKTDILFPNNMNLWVTVDSLFFFPTHINISRGQINFNVNFNVLSTSINFQC